MRNKLKFYLVGRVLQGSYGDIHFYDSRGYAEAAEYHCFNQQYLIDEEVILSCSRIGSYTYGNNQKAYHTISCANRGCNGSKVETHYTGTPIYFIGGDITNLSSAEILDQFNNKQLNNLSYNTPYPTNPLDDCPIVEVL